MSHTPLSESATPEAEETHGRHRPRGRRGAAVAITAGIAAGSLALATYAVSSSAPAPDTSRLQATIGQLNPELASDAISSRSATAGADLKKAFAETRELRQPQAMDSFGLSTELAGEGVKTLRSESAAISKARAAEREAKKAAEARAAEKAAREAAEREAAERAAAEAAAAERAAEQAAAEEAAQERAAQQAAQRQSEQSSRSAERAPAPAPAPAPVSSGDSRSIARSMLGSYGWGDDQWGCLDSLWQKESGWNHRAMNPSSGAYGIPQSLPGSKMATAGADWQTNPATQIRWGLGYIQGRYGSPCNAWAHSQANNWY